MNTNGEFVISLNLLIYTNLKNLKLRIVVSNHPNLLSYPKQNYSHCNNSVE